MQRKTWPFHDTEGLLELSGWHFWFCENSLPATHRTPWMRPKTRKAHCISLGHHNLFSVWGFWRSLSCVAWTYWHCRIIRQRWVTMLQVTWCKQVTWVQWKTLQSEWTYPVAGLIAEGCHIQSGFQKSWLILWIMPLRKNGSKQETFKTHTHGCR